MVSQRIVITPVVGKRSTVACPMCVAVILMVAIVDVGFIFVVIICGFLHAYHNSALSAGPPYATHSNQHQIILIGLSISSPT